MLHLSPNRPTRTLVYSTVQYFIASLCPNAQCTVNYSIFQVSCQATVSTLLYVCYSVQYSTVQYCTVPYCTRFMNRHLCQHSVPVLFSDSLQYCTSTVFFCSTVIPFCSVAQCCTLRSSIPFACPSSRFHIPFHATMLYGSTAHLPY